MAGLYGTLSIALSALQASQQALETTSNNVANANTPGFSRQQPVLEAGDPVVIGNLSVGTGVVLARLQSLRDPILELRIVQQTQDQGKLNAALGPLQQVQSMFSGASSGIGAAISNFFDSLQQLSTNPTDPSLREGVLTAADNMANAFNTTANNLQTQRTNLDLNVTQDVGQINTLTAQIAQLDGQITSLQNAHEDASAFVDRRTNLIDQLSGLIDVQTIQTEQGISLTTSNGTSLVSGSTSFQLSAQVGADGVQHILAQGDDITAKLTGGDLAGVIQVRDQTIPGIVNHLDQLAGGLATALNTANRQGFDFNGNAGLNLFTPPPAGNAGAASGLTVAISDPALIAASSDGTPGSNGNLVNLSGVHDEPIIAGSKPMDYYSGIVFQVGADTANISADLDASTQILQQLTDQRASVSGVSLDEEATNLVRYQTAYQAAARVVSTINAMLADAVNLGTGAAVQ